jgi:hypothetical protein
MSGRGVVLAAFAAALLLPSGCGGDDIKARKEWSKAGSLALPRAYFSITVLQSGKVLVAGGQPDYDPNWATAAVDLYDPATNLWSAATPLNTPRQFPCAVLLPSGKVLVVAGANPTVLSLATAELYDPATNTWTPTAEPMATAHGGATCSLLESSGKVLVAGGLNAANTASTAVAELYDPDTDTFTPTGSLSTARYWHTATVLSSGKVLVAGGCLGGAPCTTSTDSAELYDPDTGEWTDAGPMPYPVMSHTATRLPSGKVLIAAGCTSYDGVGGCRSDKVYEKRASLYDPAIGAAGTWSLTGALANGHSNHVALLLGSGDVLVVGGGYWSGTGTRTERYDPDTGTWAEGPRAINNHGDGPGAVRLLDGTWLVVGGVIPSDLYVGAAEIFTE